MPGPDPMFYGTYYHLYNRGNNRENIFIEERNYAHFLKLYIQYIEPVAATFAYCLLRNHFHLLVRIKSEEEIQHKLKNSKNFSASLAFSNFFNAYAKGINQAYGRTGSLFQHPFGRSPLSNFNPFERVVVYIHQNPQKHGFVQDFRDWKYSSYRSLLAEESTRLKRDEVFTWFGSRELFIKSHDLWEDNPESVQDL